MIKLVFVGLVCLAVSYIVTLPARAAASKETTFDHQNIFVSPYCWRIDKNGAAICPAGGGYLKFKFTGTTRLTLHVDTAVNLELSSIQMPALKVIVSTPTRDGVAQYFQFPKNNQPDTAIQIATRLDPTVIYSVRIHALGGDELMPGGWTTPVFQTKINSIELDSAGEILAPDLRPRRALFLGASYEQAYFGAAKADAPIFTYVDSSIAWPFFAAFGLDCEYGQIGIGSQGWVRPGNGGYPSFANTWDHYDASHGKTFGSDLDYVFVHIAENDRAQESAAVETSVSGWIPRARAAFGPRTKIFIILSITQIKSEEIKAGVLAAGDPNTFVIDPGIEFKHAAFAGGPTWAAPADGIHLDAVHQGIYTAYVLQQTQRYLDAPTNR